MKKCAVEADQAILICSELKVKLVESKCKNHTLQKHCDRGPNTTGKAVA